MIVFLIYCWLPVVIYGLISLVYYTVYDRRRRSIVCSEESRKFCDVAVFRPPAMPAGLREAVVAYARETSNGKRVVVPTKKAGRTVSILEILVDLPDLVDHYEAVAGYIAEEFDEPVRTLVGVSPLSLMVLVYENEGDEVSWHYDVNVFQGRQFTVVEPLSGFDSCTQFQYVDAEHKVVTQRLAPGEAVMLQADVLFHRATQQCAGMPPRIAVVMEFATDRNKVWWKRALDWFKTAFF